MKNIVTILVLFTVAFGAYYLYVQNNAVLETAGVEDQEMLLIKAEQFLELSTTLSAIKLDTTVLDNELFTSYQSFTRPVADESFGRANPFLPAGAEVNGEAN